MKTVAPATALTIRGLAPSHLNYYRYFTMIFDTINPVKVFKRMTVPRRPGPDNPHNLPQLQIVVPRGYPCPKATCKVVSDFVLLELLAQSDYYMRERTHGSVDEAVYWRYCSSVYFLEAQRRGVCVQLGITPPEVNSGYMGML
jgi:hypothetical protein